MSGAEVGTGFHNATLQAGTFPERAKNTEGSVRHKTWGGVSLSWSVLELSTPLSTTPLP